MFNFFRRSENFNREAIEQPDQEVERPRVKRSKPSARVETSGQFRPKGGMRGPKRSKTEVAASAPETVAPKQRESQIKPEEDRAEPEIIMSVGTWVDALFGPNLQSDAREVMQKCFSLPEKDFDETAEMNPEQVVRAYANFLMEYKKYNSRKALDSAKDKVSKMIGVEINNIPYLVDESLGMPSEADMRELEKMPSFIALAEEYKRVRGGVKVDGRISSVGESLKNAGALTKAEGVAARQVSGMGQVEKTPEAVNEEDASLSGLARSFDQAMVQNSRGAEESVGARLKNNGKKKKWETTNHQDRDESRGSAMRRRRLEELRGKEVVRDNEE